jgi:hypothetical protein
MDKSPFASYLRTNYSPTASEILEIKNFLTKPLARLTSMEAEIDRLNSIVEKLYDEHRALNAEIEAHRALLSPLRQVPLDIMEEIFTHCLPTDRNVIMSTREAPLLLGRVCSEWRSITLSTPRLWASLHIPPPAPSSFLEEDPEIVLEIEKRCNGVEEWILRSGECPLSISLHTPSPRSHSKVSTEFKMLPFVEVLKQILPSTKRWKNFSFRAPNNSLTHFQKIAEGDVPMLESLEITLTSATFLRLLVATTFMDTSGLLSAPKLRKLSLTCFRENIFSLPVCWSQLTHLTLDSEGSTPLFRTPSLLTYSQVARVLKNCLLLVSCSLRLGNAQCEYVWAAQLDFSASPNESTFILPLLQKFCLVRSDKPDEVFLKYLDLPVLRHLEMSFEIGWARGIWIPPENGRSNFVGLLAQHGNKLKHLALDISSLTQDDLICCLQSVPHVNHLHLINSATDSILDEVTDRLGPSGGNPDCFCPMLEEFRCKGSVGASFSEAQLLSFVEKRCVPGKGAALKRVDVTLHRNKPKDLQGFLISLDSRIECGPYLRSEELDDAAVDARIFVKSERGEGFSMTVVDIQYAQTKPDTFFSGLEGLDWGERDHRSSSSESPSQSFIFRV